MIDYEVCLAGYGVDVIVSIKAASILDAQAIALASYPDGIIIDTKMVYINNVIRVDFKTKQRIKAA